MSTSELGICMPLDVLMRISSVRSISMPSASGAVAAWMCAGGFEWTHFLAKAGWTTGPSVVVMTWPGIVGIGSVV